MVDQPRPLVLNVDDYDPARYARTQVLETAGFDVREAATGADALRLAVTAMPEVVLLDVNLPDMSGFEICRRIKTDPATASVPVLHVSATFVNAGARVRGLEGGADAYLTEPVEPAVLVATVHALLRMRRAEEALRASARQWQTTFDAIAEGIALLNAAGTILQVNEGFLRLLGQFASDIVGRRIGDVWQRLGVRVHDLPFARMLKSERRESADLPLGDRWFHVTADPVRAEDGGLLGAVYILGDITERRRAEEERAVLLAREKTARADAETANRAKDEFLATLSHELRAPLNVMLGWSRMLRSGLLDEPTSAIALETIERNVRLQAQLIDDLLDVSRVITGKLHLNVRPVDLAAVIESALDSIRPAAEAKSIRIEVDLDRAAGPILGDAGRLQQVIWNLVSNAVKFTPSGGRVSVRLERADGGARVAVTDTGQGIAPEFLPYVFDRFRQAETRPARSTGGLGLGLAIVRNLVELHGGTVQAESGGDGQGATFTITLPFRAPGLHPSDEGGAAVPRPAGSLPGLHGKRVLLVEDEADTRSLFTMVLEQCGAVVIAVESTRQALGLVEADPPDVIVSDIGMPGDNGYDLMRAVRALPPERGGQVPAVALTAYARSEDEAQARAAGYQVHVAKPVDPAELANVVATLLGHEGASMS